MSSMQPTQTRVPARLLSKLERRNVNVGNGERVVTAAAGGSLLAYGLVKRSVPGTILGLLGSALLVRGATGHCDVYEALGHSSAGPDPGLSLRETLTINAPAEELYRYWRPLDNLPRFMKHLKAVIRTGPLESHWVAEAPTGRTIEWDARIVAEEEGRHLAWESLPGSDVIHSGSVRFSPAPGGRGTVVEVVLRYEPLSGKLSAALATLFGGGAQREIKEDLRRFKQLMETGEIPTTDGQPSGRAEDRSAAATRPPIARRDRAKTVAPVLEPALAEVTP